MSEHVQISHHRGHAAMKPLSKPVYILWNRYKQSVNNNCLGPVSDEFSGLPYWRNKLFTTIILYLFPLSFFAAIPGIFMSIISGLPLLAIIDLLAVICLAVIAFVKSFSISQRKTLFVVMLYLLTITLLWYLGLFGPGLLYLVAITVFITLIFPAKAAYWSVAINTAVCILFGFIIYYSISNNAITQSYTPGAWIAVSSNVVILSAVMAVLLPTLFNGLQRTIDRKQQLRNELEKKQQALEHKNRELEQFAYIASHDLQEPLRSIRGLITLVKKNSRDERDQELLGHIGTAAERMRALVTGLLDYARIGREKKTSDCSCNAIVDDVLMDLAALINDSKPVIVRRQLPVLQVYPGELKQLFQNLVVNAIKFRKPGVVPEIEIGAIDQGSQWQFYVKDNGIGIADHYREKIFIIFQRLHTRAEYEGTGIGLAYCRKIAEMHGGKIWVESKEGEGATFCFTIPKQLPVYEKET
jgi:signal transduction histidine kinase